MRDRLVTALSVFETPGVWPVIWCVVAAAIYGCVPETDPMEGVAVVTVGAVIFEVIARRQMHWGVQLGVAAILLWSGMYGATGRERAYVGALFAFWPAVIVPLIAFVFPSIVRGPEARRWVVAGLGGAAALIVSRTGALEPGFRPALRSVAILGTSSLVAGLLILTCFTLWDRRSPSRT